MSDFDLLQYQSQVVSELAGIIHTNRIPNALLFSGPENTGKKQAAFLFAKGCNCLENQDTGCFRCRSCRKIDTGTHPDILTIGPEKDKKNINIAQIRQTGFVIASRPNEGRYRMVLILNADLMNLQAQNALLKMLEEPPEKTFFILIADKVSSLLPTIISRCRKFRFRPMTNTQMEAFIINELNAETGLARIAAGTAGSDIKKALSFFEKDKSSSTIPWFEKRKKILDIFVQMLGPGISENTVKALTLSRVLSLVPADVQDNLAILKTFIRDIMIFRFNPEKIVNLDFSGAFSDIVQGTSQQTVSRWIEDLFETERRIRANSALRLTLDRFFLKIAMDTGK